VSYLPFGPVKAMTLGSNLLDTNRIYDQRYLLMDNQAGTTSYTHLVNRLLTATGTEVAQYDHDNLANCICSSNSNPQLTDTWHSGC
jgi:hypothetical protein